MKLRILRLAAPLATVALLAGCSAGPGPLVAGGFSGSECIPGALYPTVTVGMSVLDDTGTSPVTITGVTLASSRGLEMTRAWLVPLYRSHGTLDYAGVQAGYPPIHWRTWPERQPIPGAVIKPGQDLNLLFGLTRTGPSDGDTSGPVITYTTNRTSYTVQGQFGFEIVPGHC